MNKIKVLITDGLASEGLKILEQSGRFEISFHNALDKEALKKILPTYEVVVIRSATRMTKELIDCATSLKIIMRAGAGVDNVDVAYASSKKVLVFNTPGVNNNSVAELTIGLLLAILREIPRATNGMKKNLWEKKDLIGCEAAGRTIGILGFGNVGNLVGKACQALGMSVIAFDPRAKELSQLLANAHVNHWANNLDDVFSASDVVSVHLPMLDSTKNLIGTDQFAKMKKGSYLIHTARGGIVNEDAILAALNSGSLAGAALDVFSSEPPQANHPLVQHPKVICTPHIGAATKEAQIKVGITVANDVLGYYTNGLTNNSVNAGECK